MIALFEDRRVRYAAEQLVSTIRFFSDRNWCPATSSNFSFRIHEHFVISRSGVDKSLFELEDLIQIDHDGNVIEPMQERPSAETGIHLAIYDIFEEANCVLHTHSVNSTILSRQVRAGEFLRFNGYEVLKGLAGNTSHEVEEIIPVIPNSQDIPGLCQGLYSLLDGQNAMHGFLIEGHGLYTWGNNILEAKRHVETFEFLFECLWKEKVFHGTSHV